MISRFFIDRPIFAAVLSIVITLAGAIASRTLAIAQYPRITPPTVSVDCNYPGASAQVVSETVAAPIEQYVNGVENMLYMSSQCTNDGSYNLTVTFKNDVNLNLAQVMVQNRVALAVPLLPDVIKQTGVAVKKKSPDILLAVAFNSPNAVYDQLFLSNYALLRLQPEVARLPGVSDVFILGQRDYSMRVWVDPERLSTLSMSAGDVVTAIREQNVSVATGQIGQQPAPVGQETQLTLSTLGRLNDVERFKNIVVKSSPQGKVTRLKDVARVELGAKNLDINCQVNGKPSVSLAIFQLPDANALETADVVKAKIAELAQDFPPGMAYEIRYDTTPFIRESIGEVYKTLGEAIVLVAIVVLLFLQNWRSALIPLIAVPVAIIGTFAAMAVLGFSINNLTLFGLVLAIGIVVDDAIVVVEAVEHHIERGLSPRDATIQAMDEVSGPVIAIGLVLSAVFIPCAFITGIVGQFFKQFALTIAMSTIISAFNSLTLSPALTALLLRPHGTEHKSKQVLPRWSFALLGGWLGYQFLGEWILPRLEQLRVGSNLPWLQIEGGFTTWGIPVACTLVGALGGWLAGRAINYALSGFFYVFNFCFKMTTQAYIRIIGVLLRATVVVILGYVGLLYLTYRDFVSTPKGFIPSQDMGYLLVNIQLPDASAAERTWTVMNRLEKIAKGTPGVKHTQVIGGQSLLLSAYGSNFGSMFTILEPFADRRDLDSYLKPNRRELFRTLKSDLPELVGSLDESTMTDQRLAQALEKLMDPKEPKQGSEWPRREIDLFIHRNPDDPLLELVNNYDFLTRLKRQKKRALDGESIAAEMRTRFFDQVPDAVATVFGPPPVRGVGRAGGFKIMIEDRGDNGPKEPQKKSDGEDPHQRSSLALDNGSDELQTQTENLVQLGNQTKQKLTGVPKQEAKAKAAAVVAKEAASEKADGKASDSPEEKEPAAEGPPALVGLFSVYRANVPQLFAAVDPKEVMSKDIDLQDLSQTLQVYLGSLYVNDINLFGRTWQVIVQAESGFRKRIEDAKRLKVRSLRGRMVPLGALADVKESKGPLVLTRYNMYPAAPINGNAGIGVSSGDAIQLMEGLAKANLPDSMNFEWTELAFLELQAGDTAMYLFGFAVVMVFLVLAAQYESWSLPLAIILVVPMCLLSALWGVRRAGEDINIFTRIGFVVLVGLASKNAILIVEFAKARREAGDSLRDSTLAACTLRLRPIVMTSMAFILGVLPLLLSYGAGAEMRRTLGITVFSGMLGVTLFGIFLTPVFFFLIEYLSESKFFRLPVVRFCSRALLFVATLGGSALLRLLPRYGRLNQAKQPDPNSKDKFLD